MSTQIPGVIHGKTIELRDHPGLIDGQEVVVTVRPAGEATSDQRNSSDGIRASAGAFADWPEADRFLEQILRERKQDTRAEIEP